MRPMDMGSTIWPEMPGSGQPIGIVLTTTTNWPRLAEWLTIPRDLTPHSILRSLTRKRRFIAAVLFFAPISTARATWWEHAEKARLPLGLITWAFVVSRIRANNAKEHEILKVQFR